MLVFFQWKVDLKRDDAFKGHPFCLHRVLELQAARMQQQARRLGLNVGRGIQRVAQDGVTHGHHVQQQLMGSTGDGLELNARCVFEVGIF